MPVVAAVDQDDDAPGFEAAHGFAGSLGLLRQAEPQHVHRRAEVLRFKPGALAHGRVPAVASDGEIGAHLEGAVRRIGAHAGDAAALLDQIDRFRPHVQVERRIALAALGQEVQEVPLRHQRDELAAGRQVGEVREGVFPVAEERAELGRLLVRQLEELVEQAKLAHHFERRGMDGVAAEIAQEVGVLFEDDDVDARAREQEAEHQPARTAADDAATRGDLFGRHSCALRMPQHG